MDVLSLKFFYFVTHLKPISHILLLWLLLSIEWFNASVMAQDRRIDSLLYLVNHTKTQDTNRVQNLYRLCFLYKEIDSKLCAKYGFEALELAIQLNYKPGEAAALNNLGNLYDYIGNKEQALYYLYKSYDIRKQLSDLKGLGNSLNNIGVIYKRDENYTKALDCYFQAKEIALATKNKSTIAAVYYNIGNVYYRMNKLDSSKHFLFLAYKDFIPQPKLFSDLCVTLSSVFIASKQLSSALHYCDTAISVLNKNKEPKNLSVLYQNKAKTYWQLNQIDSCQKQFDLALKAFTDTSDYIRYHDLLKDIADFNYFLFNRTQKTEYLKTAYITYQKLNYYYEKALEIKKAKALKNITQQLEIDDLQDKVTTINKEKALSENKLHQQRIILILVIALSMLLCVVLILFYLRSKANKRLNIELKEKLVLQEKEEKNKLQLTQFENELRLLRSQINPHFLFNSLNNIYSYAVQKKDETPELILRLSDMLRFVSETSTQEGFISCKKEVCAAANLIELYLVNKRWAKKIEYYIDPLILNSDYPIEPHSVLTLIENCFKHCNLDEENAFIRISISLFDNQMTAEISNSINKEKRLQKGEVGLSNLKKRLAHSYGKNFTLNYTEEENIYRTTLIVPLKTI